MTESPCDGCKHTQFCRREHRACDVYCIWETTGVLPLTEIKRVPERKWFDFIGHQSASE